MADETQTIHVPEGTTELVIRKGNAPVIHEPVPVIIAGVIGAPSAYLEHLIRHSQLKQELAVCIVDADTNTIKFMPTPKDKDFGDVITGKLTLNPDLTEIGINTAKRYSREELVTFLRMNRLFFPDLESHAKLLQSVRKFDANVSERLSLDSTQKNRGNTNVAYEKTVNAGDVPFNFFIQIPVFKGSDPKKFDVEVCLDVSDGSVRFWLESPELAEIIQETEKVALDEEVKKFTEAGVTVIRQS